MASMRRLAAPLAGLALVAMLATQSAQASHDPNRTATIYDLISIRYAIGGALTPVQLAIYDVRGRLVQSLVHDLRPPGEYVQPWNRSAATGRRVAPGIYIVRLLAGDVAISRKLAVMK
jgi:hypothetical protein